MANIEQSIRSLADEFVHGVLRALSSVSVSELYQLAEAPGGGGGKGRASAASASHGPKSTRGGKRKAAPEPAAPSRASKSRGRRVRRSSEDVTHLAAQVAEFVEKSGGNIAVSDIAKELAVSTTEITRPIAIALREGKIHKTGEKRLTRYYAGEGAKPSRRKGKASAA